MASIKGDDMTIQPTLIRLAVFVLTLVISAAAVAPAGAALRPSADHRAAPCAPACRSDEWAWADPSLGSSITDARHAALLGPSHALSHLAGPSDTPAPAPQAVVGRPGGTARGFDWADAGIGAGTALGTALLVVLGIGITRRRHSVARA
jgi:hypothetical protein